MNRFRLGLASLASTEGFRWCVSLDPRQCSKMRLKQDPVYTRFGATHVFLEPSDAMFDIRPTRPVPSFTRRKKVNRIYRRNRAGRMVLVHMLYNVDVGGEAEILVEQDGDLGQEAEVQVVVDLGGVAEALEAVDPGAVPEVQEQALLDEGDEADYLASLLEAKGAAGAAK